MEGLVIRSTGSWYAVKDDSGTVTDCGIKGKFRIKGIKSTNPVAVGDRVSFELTEDGKGVIHAIEDRKNYIIRKATNLSKQTHIIAANIDQVILIVTLAMPRTLTGFIDRFLVTAEAYRIPVIIVFNKKDIYDEKLNEELQNLKSVYEKAGYRCMETSATEGINLDKMSEAMAGKVNLIAGNSGVGKSTLINAIEPGLELKTAEVSELHELGKHTTSFAEMFGLSGGGYIIDTPGIKSFGMVDFKKEELWHYFPEIFKSGEHCKFHNCVHINEPECEVKAAVENGDIASFRYENYLKIYYGEDLDLRF